MIKKGKNVTMGTIGVKRMKPNNKINRGKRKLLGTGLQGFWKLKNYTSNVYRRWTNDVEIMEEAYYLYEQRLYCSILALVIMEEQRTNNREIDKHEAERIYEREYKVRGGETLKQRIQRGHEINTQFFLQYRKCTWKQRLLQLEEMHQDYVTVIVESLEDLDSLEQEQVKIFEEDRYTVRRNQLHEKIYALMQTHKMINRIVEEYKRQLEG